MLIASYDEAEDEQVLTVSIYALSSPLQTVGAGRSVRKRQRRRESFTAAGDKCFRLY